MKRINKYCEIWLRSRHRFSLSYHAFTNSLSAAVESAVTSRPRGRALGLERYCRNYCQRERP